MNANKLADDLDNANGFQYLAQLGLASQAATMLRHLQTELDRAVELYTDKAIENEALHRFIDERGETGQLIIWKAQEK